jgi:ATP-dependent Lon protease
MDIGLALIAMCSGALTKPVQSQVAVLGSVSLGGTINKVDDLANTLQVCLDAGAKKILLPMANARDLATVPPELFVKFQIMFYSGAEDAIF